jgi:hypothetical protein
MVAGWGLCVGWDDFFYGIKQNVDVYASLSGHGDDGCVFCHSAFHEVFDFLVTLHRLPLVHYVDFVLDDDDVFDAGDFGCG